MRIIDAGLQARLDEGVTTLARAWIVALTNGERIGFTEHDEDVVIDGVNCQAGASFVSGDLDSSSGLTIDSGGWSGALSANGVHEQDLRSGLYDNAAIAAYLVDWNQPDSVILLWAGALGEVRRGEFGFEAELKGSSAKLSVPLGRIYARHCDADLGDARCGVNLSAPAFSGSGGVAALIGPRRFAASGLGAFAPGMFARGILHWTSGANVGASSEVVSHDTGEAGAILELLELGGSTISVGDAFSIKAGCDKSFATCRVKFANQPNFRGFPHMPGDDVIQAAPAIGDRHDGGARD